MRDTIPRQFRFYINIEELKDRTKKIIQELLTSKYNRPAQISKKSNKRKYFLRNTKRAVLFRQQYKCNLCKFPLNGIQDFHHINGDRSDNSPVNCEALCPNCHAKKTRNVPT